MKRFPSAIWILATASLWSSSCAKKQAARDASVMAYVPAAPDYAAGAPAALSASSAPTGPRVCDEAACPTVAQVLKPFFDGTAETSIPALLARGDQRMAEMAARAVDHFVPCLEEDGQLAPATLGTKVVLNPLFHCYAFFSLENAGQRGADYEHVLFSRGDETPSHGAVRLGQVDDNAATTWIQRDASSASLDVWRATSRTLANEGKTYVQARVGPGKELEISAVGLSQFSGDAQFSCGLQVKANADLVFVRGRFFPGTDISVARDSTACDELKPTGICVQASDFAAVTEASCTAAGLDAFALTELVPTDLGGDGWGDAVNIDLSDLVNRFSLSGLDIY